MMKKHMFVLLFLCVSISLFAQEQYHYGTYSTSKGQLNYRYITPDTVIAGKKYPVVLFLHGAGERGSDNEKQLTHGGQMFLNPVVREMYPAYVIFPQCPEETYWNLEHRPSAFIDSVFYNYQHSPTIRIEMLSQLIDSMMRMPSVDSHRIYIMGLSMGAMATYELSWRYPSLFAAAVPICGATNVSELYRAKNVAFRIYHGDADNIVPVNNSRRIYKALRDVDASVLYIEFPGCNHGSWNPAFNDPELLHWLFKQHK